eukprot:CAMPEP_0173098696 /NCGR_PEP_ID=MMETSP1102-20130122/34934_1 /TAXON_ID=49646 /ORGANISM="Geminigera sp., Strain Caron Lab Isolate" /LENGTH=76 /DNA_ID=CAMNT_0013991341 /DNA_START=125 /DNA_END=355 /DNA_ORIENTATION=-
MAGGNVPDFDGFVVAAAGDKLAVRRKSDGSDTARVAGQRRLAFKSASRAHQPDFHRLVIAAAGQLAILAPCNRHHR